VTMSVPPEVESFSQAYALNVKAWEFTKPKGFIHDTWVLTVHDHGTCEDVKIVLGLPKDIKPYKSATITNKWGVSVTVLMPREEAVKVEARVPTAPGVAKALEEGEDVMRRATVKRPPAVVEPKLRWGDFKRDVARFGMIMANWEKAVEERRSTALYSYLHTFQDRCRLWLEEMTRVSTWVAKAQRRVEAPPILTDEEVKRLWEELSKVLREAGLKPEAYRDRFEPLIDRAFDYQDNLAILLDEARSVVAEQELLKGKFKVVRPPPRPFSWKRVGWGVAKIKVELASLMDSPNKAVNLR